jgi:hypothetical protein
MSTPQNPAYGPVTRLRALRVALIAALITVGVFALPASSFGQATVEDVLITSPVEPFVVDDTCAGPGVLGILTGTDTLAGRTVETDTGFHFAGSLTLVYRIELADGSYVVGSQIERLTFSGREGHEIFGGTLLDKGTLYDANGAVIGDAMFNARFRWNILNGTPVVEIDDGRLTCR